MQRDLQRYVAPANFEKDESSKPEYWPLVKSVTVLVPSHKLPYGGVLVDLPGTGDFNAARLNATEEVHFIELQLVVNRLRYSKYHNYRMETDSTTISKRTYVATLCSGDTLFFAVHGSM